MPQGSAQSLKLARQVEQRCDPVVQAMYSGDFTAALAASAALRSELTEGAIDATLGAALGYELAYLEFHIDKARRRAVDAQAFVQAEQALTQPCGYKDAEALRDRLLLQLYASAERSGFREFSAADFAALFARIPEHERTHEFWHFAANWAFAHSELFYLEQAYEALLTTRETFANDWSWQRVHLMYLLLSGNAQSRDAELTVKYCTLLPQLLDFERHILPRIVDAGLADERFGAQLQAKRAELEPDASAQ
jgi:hypothetical protein